MPQPLLVGEDGVAQFVPAIVEQVHGADLVNPLLRRVMGRMNTARDVIDEERLARARSRRAASYTGSPRRPSPWSDSIFPPGKGWIGVVLRNRLRLPLAGVAADKSVKIIKAHPGRPLVERPGLARLIKWRVVVLAKPRRRVTVLLQDFADCSAFLADDRIVTRKTRGRLAHDAKAGDVMVAARNQRRARRRAERCGMKLGVTQSVRRDAVERRGRDHAAERARRAEADNRPS